ncbi:MAG: multidrug efflux RND transporter permease subunit [Deltaproteobacteria bacterium]|nr:multidrug efflux RND transporter permease subunit [Deltaproteobacteria bacterium]
MFSKFFIERPIFSAVISIIIVIGGAVTLFSLPIAQYPNMAPPTVTVSTSYPGANAQVVADTVAAPIEQEVNGVQDMLYMSSTSAADGSYNLTVTFKTGVDLDMATVLVQNRVAVAQAKLPEDVKRLGVTTKKKSPDFALTVNVSSPDGRYSDIYLSNYTYLNLKDEISRISGVGDVVVWGAAEYSMRLWLDPNRLKYLGLTTDDVVNAIQEQNVQVAAGIVGQAPAPKGQAFQFTVTTLGRLENAEQFKDIILRATNDGRIIRVKDVGRVELGAKDYTFSSQLNGKSTVTLAVFQLPGANAIQLSNDVQAAMKRLSEKFPEGMEYVISYDASDVVRASIKEIITTLLEAALLVFLTVYIFLQDFRATIVPAITIPVSLIGTFSVMAALGFSLNTLTLFGLVLAIGIVVDDAIVVVENATRNIAETGLPAKEATIKAMTEVTGPVVATTLVLLAVFIPASFMAGISGIMFKQFALTIATATVFSSINALTMSPTLCALLLRPARQTRNPVFKAFNWGMTKSTNAYMGIVGSAVRRLIIGFMVFGGLLALMYFSMTSTPTSFVPPEDQGYALVNIQLPDGASLERTQMVVEKVNKIIDETPGIANNIALIGYSLLDGTNNANMGGNYIIYKPWDERAGKPAESQAAIIGHLRKELSKIQDANCAAFVTPPIPGVGLAGGFQMMLQDRGAMGLPALQQMAQEIVEDGNAQPGLVGLYTTFRAGVPQLFVDVDRTKVKTLGVPLSSVFSTLQAYMGSTYVNDFNKFGRTYQVRVQADSKYRAQAEDIRKLDVRNDAGAMIPLSTLARIEDFFGPQVIFRYNLYPSASIYGSAAPGYSSGEALNTMAALAKAKLPSAMGYEWTGLSYQEATGGSGAFIFVLAVVFVYLVLAAQYESWKIPFAVILVVPIAVLGAFLAIIIRGLDFNVYTQIGLVLLVGLAAKNAILIVEFAKEARDREGKGIIEAALEACRLRFRPILMTAFSFILGVIPLVIATGAGAGSRRAMGTSVLGGMLLATVLGVVFTPIFYVTLEKLGEFFQKKPQTTSAAESKDR